SPGSRSRRATGERLCRTTETAYTIGGRAMRPLRLFACLVVAAGCGRPAQIGSDPEAYKAVDALFTAVTARRADLVDSCDKQLRRLHEQGKLPEAAHRELDAIVARARAGRWDPAIDA